MEHLHCVALLLRRREAGFELCDLWRRSRQVSSAIAVFCGFALTAAMVWAMARPVFGG